MDQSPAAGQDGDVYVQDARRDSPRASRSDHAPALKRARSSSSHTNVEVASPEQRVGDSLPPTSSNSVSQGGFDYPRRRAVIACEICRSRKSRCNGGRPKCSLCRELKAECVYREPGTKLDAGDKLILERLSHIEGLIQSSLMCAPAAMAAPTGPVSPATSNTASDDTYPKRVGNVVASVASPLALSGVGMSGATNISTMPKVHTTPALHLLQWPIIRDLVSRQCDPQILMQLEMAREPINLTMDGPLDLNYNVSTYAQAFFEKANIWYAVVSPYAWRTLFRAATTQGFQGGAESCVVLLVLALGKAAHAGVKFHRHAHHHPGMDYFAAAWQILPGLIVRNDVISAQCHILAAAYMMYIVRPLEAWNLLCSASIKLQLLLSSPGSIPAPLKDLSDRIYWNTLMIESDLLAELDLPHSGIVQFEESMRLPRSFQYDATVTGADDHPPGSDDLWYFLAEIALRRLLNRVSHLIYAHKRTSPTQAIAALEPVVAELDYQLTQWYEGLPPTVRFPRERLPAQNPIQTVLRLRYFACRTIIFRPYVQAVLADDALAHEPAVRAACAKCLEACLRQLENLPAHHVGHLPYLWQGALSIVSQTLLLMGASLCDVLASLLPPRPRIDSIFAEVVREIERLAPMAPSLKLCAEIVREADERRRALLLKPKHYSALIS